MPMKLLSVLIINKQCSPWQERNLQILYNVFGYYVQFLPRWVSCLQSLYFNYLFPRGTFTWFCWLTLLLYFFRILQHIEANKRNVEIELKEHLKLCRWERTETCLSVETSKRTRQKLKKIIQKYTVSNIKVIASHGFIFLQYFWVFLGWYPKFSNKLTWYEVI